MKLEIYDHVTRKRLNMIKVFSYAQYVHEYNGIGSFSIIMYPDENVMKHIVFGNYILFDDGVVGIIKGVKNYEDDVHQIEISGYLSNVVFTYRYFLLTTRYNDTVTNIIFQMFKDLFVQSKRPERNISFLKISEDEKYLPEIKDKIMVQNTGDNFLDVFNEKFFEYNLGIELYPVIVNYDEEKGKVANLDCFEFRVSKSVNRTIGNKDGNVPIVFSFELSNLSQLTYEEDGKEYASVVIVAAEGVGENRKVIEVGDTSLTGIDRIEYYVDARDIQSEQSTSGSGGSGNNGGGTEPDPDEPDEPVNPPGEEKVYNLKDSTSNNNWLTLDEVNVRFDVPKEIQEKITKVVVNICTLTIGKNTGSGTPDLTFMAVGQRVSGGTYNTQILRVEQTAHNNSSVSKNATNTNLNIENFLSIEYFQLYTARSSGGGTYTSYSASFDIDLYYKE